ncbi:hypothetical protein AAHA92_23962 [Salvia divinorum]|uniref:Secreted protein n=1 Tax=Salvia divinorum TaxID=28513 RepID=A0ABD1G8I0_SALDI
MDCSSSHLFTFIFQRITSFVVALFLFFFAWRCRPTLPCPLPIPSHRLSTVHAELRFPNLRQESATSSRR